MENKIIEELIFKLKINDIKVKFHATSLMPLFHETPSRRPKSPWYADPFSSS